jgi:hypothetical protein
VSTSPAEACAAFDAAAWNRQQYTIQRIRTDPGFQNYIRGLPNAFDSVTPRDLTCGDERILGPRITFPGCGILQSDSQLDATGAALAECKLPMGRLRRHRQCGAERLSGMSEPEICERLDLIAEVFGVTPGPPCEMLPVDGKIARAAIVAGHDALNSCALEGMAPLFCSAISSTVDEDVQCYMDLSLTAMPGRFSPQDPFVIAIVGDSTRPERSTGSLRSRIASVPRIAELWRAGIVTIVGADF